MFSLPIFKQTVQANYRLWLIFTVIVTFFITMFIATYDPSTNAMLLEMVQEMDNLPPGLGDLENMPDMSSIMGILGQAFYGMIAVVLPIVYVIITANGLVASQVDQGSMAYTLSTPTNRVAVVFTKAVYLVGSLFLMFLIVTTTGLIVTEAVHQGISDKGYAVGIKEASNVLNVSQDEVANDLSLILNNEQAIQAGADARGIETNIYVMYLEMLQNEKAYQVASQVLGVSVMEINANPALIRDDETALNAVADALNISVPVYRAQLDQIIMQSTLAPEMQQQFQRQMDIGIAAAAEALNMDVSDLNKDVSIIQQDDNAFNSALQASGLNANIFTMMLNQQLAMQQKSQDIGLGFDLESFLILNIGVFLLMFAISGVSYLASCVFNLSKHSLAIGAGIPLAFFIFNIVQQINESMEFFRYFTFISLYDAVGIASGDYNLLPLVVLALLGVALYGLGIQAFKTKDLPL